MCGLKVVVVATDSHGNIDFDDLMLLYTWKTAILFFAVVLQQTGDHRLYIYDFDTRYE